LPIPACPPEIRERGWRCSIHTISSFFHQHGTNQDPYYERACAWDYSSWKVT
jgi:hypothetical protein